MSDPTTTPTPTNEQRDVRERAARALYEHRQATNGYPPDGYTAWDDLSGDWQDEYREAADAVLAAVSAAAPDEREALGVAADLIDWLADARDEYASAGGPYADAIHQETALARTLAKALRNPEDAWGWLPTWMAPEYEARHAAALAARPAPTVNAADVEITTAAELDALPAGTIVRDRFGGYLAQGRDAMGVAWFHYPVYDHAGSSALVAGIGPVTVCFTPGLTVADEGRAEA